MDSSGTLHLVWVEWDGIHYSSAPAWATTTGHSWSAPTLITNPGYVGTPLQLGCDGEDRLHLVYSDWGNGSSPTDGNLYYVYSADGGDTWSEPLKVSAFSPGQEVVILPRMAVDATGQLHIVWSQNSWPGWQQMGVYYARFASGDEPTEVVEVMHRRVDDRWMTAPSVALAGSQIQMTWVCGELPHRCYQWSADGGDTWSAPRQVFGDLISLANWDALAVDSAGTPYWIAQLRYPEAMYYSVWKGTSWMDPPERPDLSGQLGCAGG